MSGRGTRGRGRGRNGRGRGRGRSSGSSQRTTTRSAPPPPLNQTLLQNGEKGAQVHTVQEQDRIRLTKILMDLRENDDATQLEFPPTLTNTERKFVHQLAGQLGLVSKSSGKGENRRIKVSKRNEQVLRKTATEIPLLCVGKKGIDAMKRHVQKYPPTHAEELESHETGASLLEAFGKATDTDTDPDAALESTLKQLGLVSQAAPKSNPKQVRIDLERRQRFHAKSQALKHASKDYATMQKLRSRLPVFQHQEAIVSTVAQNAVTIVSADTGAGKSTQVPQFLLDANPTCNIVVTQPRRISAISIAERVAQEQCCDNGLIGYQVRQESSVCRDTQLLFLTPGVLLQKLRSSPQLFQFTHIIIDEIHEKDRYTEFLLILLRDLLPQRPDLRLILMSATLQTEALFDYFSSSQPALMEIEGHVFPVQEYFLEDVLRMTGYIDESTTVDGGVMMNNQFERELAKYTNEQQQQQQITFTCNKCGQTDFPNDVEFGIHVTLCDGKSNDGRGDDNDENDELGFLEPSDASNLADIDFDQLEEYNVEEKIVIDESFEVGNVNSTHAYDDHGDSESQSAAVEEADASVEKWDGSRPFEPMNAVDSTLKDDELLTQYQAMHDDEQVDMYLLLEVVQYIIKSSYGDGAILVFLPGWQEISELIMLLESIRTFRDKSKYRILPLHSGIPSRDQRKVLQVPPKGVRKIILSTNIAETSLTVEDVSFVVDTGRAKEKSYDPHLKTSTLQPAWISQASSKQRKGRAGRTKVGVCFHLFSRRRHESMRAHVESELLRTPLEEMCLMCKELNLAPGGPEDSDGVPAFLAKAMSPPHPKSISNALSLLVDLGAMLPETNDLTNLGRCLSVLSLEPRVGKMVLWSYLLGCAQAASNMAVAMSYKSPFVLPLPGLRRAADDAKIKLSKNSESDQIMILYALQRKDELKQYERYNRFCQQHFLSTNTLSMIADLRKNLTKELTSLGFPQPTLAQKYHNRHNKDHSLWQAAIAAGLYPNVASRQRGEVNFSTMSNRKAKIHVSSVNAIKGQPLSMTSNVPKGEVEFVCFGEMVKGTKLFTMEQTTHLASPLPLLLLCGVTLGVMPDPNDNKLAILNVDDWIVFRCDADTAAFIVILRKRLESSFLRLVANPAAGLSNLSDAERDAVETTGSVSQSAHQASASR